MDNVDHQSTTNSSQKLCTWNRRFAYLTLLRQFICIFKHCNVAVVTVDLSTQMCIIYAKLKSVEATKICAMFVDTVNFLQLNLASQAYLGAVKACVFLGKLCKSRSNDHQNYFVNFQEWKVRLSWLSNVRVSNAVGVEILKLRISNALCYSCLSMHIVRGQTSIE